VTRGALEKLSRNELQGVIAHEFSHALNGDMRLNIRLMGALFGILVLAVVGRKVLRHTRHVGGSRNKGAGAVLLIAFALMVVGYIGLFFGRWIKAAVSRQREYLADASAVQFTRDPESIGGALKKIAVHGEGSYLLADSEEVGHMLFGAGQKMNLFATHPPLMERIQRIDPSFQRGELQELADRIRRDESRAAQRTEQAAARAAAPRGGFDAGNILEEIGNPGWQRLAMAAAIAASIPEAAMRAATSSGWAMELLLAGLMDPDPEIREEQLLVVARNLGGESEGRVRDLLKASISLRPEQRLPLLEIALPNLKQRPVPEQEKLVKTIDELIRMDGRIEMFEYLLARLVTQYLWEAANPRKAARIGSRTIESLGDPARTVLAVLARHGQADAGQVLRAYRAGLEQLGLSVSEPVPDVADWVSALDRALRSLDDLRPEGRKRLVEAMVATTMSDATVAPAEIEMMRAVCATLHVPVPVLGAPVRT